MTLREQWSAMMQTDVLVGVHGAGLANAMFLHSCGVLLEMWPMGKVSARPYSEFHSRYLRYDDEYCDTNLPCRSGDLRGTHRNLMVNVSRLRTLAADAVATWRACYFWRDVQDAGASGAMGRPQR